MTLVEELPMEILLHIFLLGCEVDSNPWPLHSEYYASSWTPAATYLSKSEKAIRMERRTLSRPQLKYFAAKMATVCHSWRSIIKDTTSNLSYINLYIRRSEIQHISSVRTTLLEFPGADIDVRFGKIDTPKTLEGFLGMLASFKSRIRSIELSCADRTVISILNSWGTLANLECLRVTEDLEPIGGTITFQAPSLRHISFDNALSPIWDLIVWIHDDRVLSTPFERVTNLPIEKKNRRGPVVHISARDAFAMPSYRKGPSFFAFPNLKTLCLSCNQLGDFPRIFQQMNLLSLETLHLKFMEYFNGMRYRSEHLGPREFPSLRTLLVDGHQLFTIPCTSEFTGFFQAPQLRRMWIASSEKDSQYRSSSRQLLGILGLGQDSSPSQLFVDCPSGNFGVENLRSLASYAPHIDHILLRGADGTQGLFYSLTLGNGENRYPLSFPRLKRLSLDQFSSNLLFTFFDLSSCLTKLDFGGSFNLEWAEYIMLRTPYVEELSLRISSVDDLRLLELLLGGETAISKMMQVFGQTWSPRMLPRLTLLETHWDSISDIVRTELEQGLLVLLSRRKHTAQPVMQLLLPSPSEFDQKFFDKIKHLHVEVSLTAASPFKDFDTGMQMEDCLRY